MPYRRNIVSKYFVMWIGLSAFVGGLLYQLYDSDYGTELEALKRSENNIVRQTRDDIEYVFSRALSDLRYLSSLSPLVNFLDYPSEQNRQLLGQSFASELHARTEHYLQLRYLDLNGREITRVDNLGGELRIAPYNELQDKSGRYYVKRSLELTSANQVYISPIDLNVEHGKIVVPHQPVIRFAVKIFRHNVARGILIVNYDVQHVLDLSVKPHKTLWLVNEDGYWLTGVDSKLAWGFMFPDRTNTRLQDYYPDIWKQISKTRDLFQNYYQAGLMTHSSVHSGLFNSDPSREALNDMHTLHIFSFIPQEKLGKNFSELKNRYLILFISVVVITGLSLYFLYKSSSLNEKSADEARHSRLKFQQLVEFAPDAMVVCRPNGTIVLINKQAERLFQYQHNALVGKPVSMLVPKEYREHHDHHIQSYVKSPTVRPMGGEGSELYGLRKDGTEFPVSISLSPIDSGKDMLIVSAIRDLTPAKRSRSKKQKVA